MSQELSGNKLRTQFSFVVDDSTLSRILNDIASQDISITGYLQTKPFISNLNYSGDMKSNLVRLVVGSPNSETSTDLMGVRNILNSLDINFEEKSIIQILQIVSGIPGIINGLFGALWRKVTVNAFYLGEDKIILSMYRMPSKPLSFFQRLILSNVPGYVLLFVNIVNRMVMRGLKALHSIFTENLIKY